MVAYTVIYIKDPLVCNIMYLLHHIVHKMMMVMLCPALLSGCSVLAMPEAAEDVQ